MTPREPRLSRSSVFLLVITLVVLAGTAALAQPAHRVADINTTANGSAAYPWGDDAVTLAGLAYFVASDGVSGAELWRSDGTAAGTARVKDICPGSCPSAPLFLTAVGSELFFTADDGAHGRELWKSDGTEAGTVLVQDLVPGITGTSLGQLAEINGLLFFTADDGVHGSEPWVSDGTAAGTVLLADVQPGTATSSPWLLGKLGTTLFFSADDGVHGNELWKTDGTPGGTTFVKDINPGSGSSLTFGSLFFFPKAAAVGGQLLFAADDGTHGTELWATDGTGPGTLLLGDLSPGSDSSGPFDFVAAGALVYFEAQDPVHGQELWASDGTPGGTALVRDIQPGTGGSRPFELTAVGSLVFFSADDGSHGRELWKSDGTSGGTVIVKDIHPGAGTALSGFTPAGLTASSNRLLFFADDGVHGAEPWVSDGSDAGTILLADLNPGPPASFLGQAFGLYRNTFAAGRWFFSAYAPATGGEMYASDGTPGGTGLLVQINHQTSAFDLAFLGSDLASPGSLADLGGTLVFQATDGVSGEEPWKTDGTAAGTTQVADLLPGSAGSFPYLLTAFGGALFFTTQTGTNDGLWKTDGTAAGTVQVSPVVVSELKALGGTLFFSGDDGVTGVTGAELWKSDGSGPGTSLLKDIAPGSAASSPYELTAFGPALLFAATGPESTELWRSDGTPGGTAIVKDIEPGTGASSPSGLTVAGPRLFFSASETAGGRELWATDGTGPGTYRVKDLCPGACSSNPGVLTALGGELYFSADDGITGGHGAELWKSDGTDAGTVLVKDIFPGSRSSEITALTAALDRLYFVADDGVHGRELWASDGTDAGTVLVADLFPGPGSSLPLELHAVGSRLVFSAYDGSLGGHGRELWKSNGTAAGTVLLQDLNPGPESSSPMAFTESGGTLYFVANDGMTGFELWALPLAAVADALDFYTVAPCRIADTRSGAPMISGVVRTFALTGVCGIPATARAVAANLTVVHPGGPGFLRVYPSGGTVPMTSTVNFNRGGTRTNNALLTLAGSGVDVFLSLSGGGGADLVLDVVGYFE
jgi:ELWxxDGT repeat protein